MNQSWSELFKQLILAYIRRKIDGAYVEGLKNAERLSRRYGKSI